VWECGARVPGLRQSFWWGKRNEGGCGSDDFEVEPKAAKKAAAPEAGVD
jgi:hypothetical protein